jgi:hypothetical protein
MTASSTAESDPINDGLFLQVFADERPHRQDSSNDLQTRARNDKWDRHWGVDGGDYLD